MKAIVLLALAIGVSTAHGQVGETKCEVKSKNAASFQLAQEVGVPVQQIEVLMYEPGPWTDMFGENTGHNFVDVKLKDFEIRYLVFGQQVGSSSDCQITKVMEGARSMPR
ncbi:MAG: hypothetical protein NDI61_06420 [Bdellovibrionaceae bacterium]|nr:hypothetical protein [Pseudobdellovibrionaceae bacterium]